MSSIYTDNTLKTVREALCFSQTFLPTTNQGMMYRSVLQDLIDEIDLQRPLGTNGKHDTLHTKDCGCIDK